MTIKEKLSEINPDAILWDGLDSAIIGFTNDGKAVYDIDKMIIETQQMNDISFEDATEWVDFNILNAYVGEYTPVHIYSILEED
jgi:hypothetical protein